MVDAFIARAIVGGQAQHHRAHADCGYPQSAVGVCRFGGQVSNFAGQFPHAHALEFSPLDAQPKFGLLSGRIRWARLGQGDANRARRARHGDDFRGYAGVCIRVFPDHGCDFGRV